MCEIALTESSQLFLPVCPFPFQFGEIWLSALEPFGSFLSSFKSEDKHLDGVNAHVDIHTIGLFCCPYSLWMTFRTNLHCFAN